MLCIFYAVFAAIIIGIAFLAKSPTGNVLKSLPAKLVTSPEMTCKMFHLAPKPYWWISVVAILNFVLMAFTFSKRWKKGWMTYLTIAYFAISLIFVIYEAISIILAVLDAEYPKEFFVGKTSTWDRYEVVIYLFMQSSVFTMTMGFLYGSLLTLTFGYTFEDLLTHGEEIGFLKTMVDDEDPDLLFNRESLWSEVTEATAVPQDRDLETDSLLTRGQPPGKAGKGLSSCVGCCGASPQQEADMLQSEPSIIAETTTTEGIDTSTEDVLCTRAQHLRMRLLIYLASSIWLLPLILTHVLPMTILYVHMVLIFTASTLLIAVFFYAIAMLAYIISKACCCRLVQKEESVFEEISDEISHKIAATFDSVELHTPSNLEDFSDQATLLWETVNTPARQAAMVVPLYVASIFIMQSMCSYGILLYGSGMNFDMYFHIVQLEYNSRCGWTYFTCLYDYFLSSTLSFVDFFRNFG